MLKQHRVVIQCDPRGKIKTGMKNPKNNAPVGLDYFRIDAFPELLDAYGPKPTMLIVLPPTDNLGDFFDDGFEKWGSNETKIRTCDGEKCLHYLEEQVGQEKFAAGEETECICQKLNLPNHPDERARKLACKYSFYLRALVAHPKSGQIIQQLPYLFEGHSVNSGNNVHQAITDMAGLTTMMTEGFTKLAFVPFRLSVEMKRSRRNPKSRFPIWNMGPFGTIQQTRQRLLQLSHLFKWEDEVKKRIAAYSDTGLGLPMVPDVPALPPASASKTAELNDLFPEPAEEEGDAYEPPDTPA